MILGMLLVILSIWALLGVAGYKLADERGRDPVLGAILGVVLGLFGLVIILILPKRVPVEYKNDWTPLSQPKPVSVAPAVDPFAPATPLIAAPVEAPLYTGQSGQRYVAPRQSGYVAPAPPQQQQQL